MKIYFILIIPFFAYSCGSYVKLSTHNKDIKELQEKIFHLNKKEYEMRLKIDSMNSQLIIFENQLIKLKKKIIPATSKTSKNSLQKDIVIKNKLTQDEILKITELSKKEDDSEEPIVLTNSMLGTSYKENSKRYNHKLSAKTKNKYNKKYFLKIMKSGYANALKLHRDNKFDESIAAFNKLIKKYSNIKSSLTDNFYYWLGENYLSLKDIPLARKNFNIVLKKYPKANKVPDAMFKLGFILEQEGRASLAIKDYYKILVKKYSNTEAGKLAIKRLQDLRP